MSYVPIKSGVQTSDEVASTDRSDEYHQEPIKLETSGELPNSYSLPLEPGMASA